MACPGAPHALTEQTHYRGPALLWGAASVQMIYWAVMRCHRYHVDAYWVPAAGSGDGSLSPEAHRVSGNGQNIAIDQSSQNWPLQMGRSCRECLVCTHSARMPSHSLSPHSPDLHQVCCPVSHGDVGAVRCVRGTRQRVPRLSLLPLQQPQPGAQHTPRPQCKGVERMAARESRFANVVSLRC